LLTIQFKPFETLLATSSRTARSTSTAKTPESRCGQMPKLGSGAVKLPQKMSTDNAAHRYPSLFI